MSLLLLFTTPGAAAPGIAARGMVAGGQYDAHHARRRARLVAAAGALLLAPAVRASPTATIEGTGTLAAPVATVTGGGAAGAARRGVRLEADYRATTAARDARRSAWPVSSVLLGVPRLPPVVGSGVLSVPIATVTGVGGPPSTTAPVARGVLASDYAPHRAAARARLDALRSQVVVPKRRAAAVTTGTGTIGAPIATVTGAGSPVVTGAGALAAPIATITGASADLLLGSGVLGAPVARLTGAGVGVVLGSGALAAPIAQILGLETRPPRLSIDVRLSPVLAVDARLVGPLSVDAGLAPTLRVTPTLDPVIAL